MKENRTAGFTLVEMLVAMMISMIVITGVAQFMVSGTKQYQAVDNQVSLQMEAQSVVNAITDMIMEGNNVAVREIGGQKYFSVYYNLDKNDATINFRTAEQKIVWLDTTTKKMYLMETDSGSEYDNATDGASPAAGDTFKQLLAEGVADIEYTVASAGALTANGVSTGINSSNPTIGVKISLQSKVTSQSTKEDGYTYIAQDAVAMRNEIVRIPS